MQQTNIGIIGTGYVGLVTGICLASLGHKVNCIDIDQKKIDALNNGVIPIYEPGLTELLAANYNNITFSTSLETIRNTEIVLIAVGTPTDYNSGEADLSYIKQAIRSLNSLFKDSFDQKLLVIKSTVPPGTNDTLLSLISNPKIELASNPEFLREGCAIEDFFNPDRIIIGVRSTEAEHIFANIYKKITDKDIPLIKMDPLSAELAKYTANSFLAMKISFANEIARISDKIGADSKLVLDSIKFDHRIGKYFLEPGPGYGGSCFPKDCLALSKVVDHHHINAPIINNITHSNEMQKNYIIETITKLVKPQSNILVLGLTFKANTDDVRDAASQFVIPKLLENNYGVTVYDPMYKEAKDQERFEWNINWLSSIGDLDSYEAILILTEWSEFIELKNYIIPRHIKLIDFRNLFNPEEMIKLKINYYAVGRMGAYEHKQTLV